jgi:hypothetical protein
VKTAGDLGLAGPSQAMQSFESFTTKWIVSEERAVRCLAEKVERCLTFYDFLEADWSKSGANNVAERASRFVAPASASDRRVHRPQIGGADLRSVRREWNGRRSHPLEAIYTT